MTLLLSVSSGQCLLAQATSNWKRPEGDPPAWLTADAAAWTRSNETGKVLARKISYDFKKTPFKELIAEISRQIGVPIRINEAEISNLGYDGPQLRVSGSGQDIRLSEAFRHLLHPFKINYRIRATDIEITSEDDLQRGPLLCVYDMAHKSVEPANMDTLKLVIVNTVDVDQWKDYGGKGDGTIMTFGSALIVNAPELTQRKIAQFVTQLNKMPVGDHYDIHGGYASRPQGVTLPFEASFPTLSTKSTNHSQEEPAVASKETPTADSKWSAPKSPAPAWLASDLSVERQAIFKRLQEPVDFKVDNLPLDESLNALLKGPGVVIGFDKEEIEGAGQSLTAPISIDARRTSRHEILQRILVPRDLVYRIEGQQIFVTAASQVFQSQSLRVYDMAYLTEKPIDMQSLIFIITTMVHPEIWADFGGQGEGKIIPAGSQLFVSAPDQTLQAIEALLYQISLLHPDNLPPEKPIRP